MKIILNQDVPNLGEEGDVCVVKDGYARNYLIPTGAAVLFNRASQALFADRAAAIEKRKVQKRYAAKTLKERIDTLTVTAVVAAGETGKLFGSVTSLMVQELLAKEGIELERKKLEVPTHTIKAVGTYTIAAHLYENETAHFSLVVKSSADVAKEAAASVGVVAEEPVVETQELDAASDDSAPVVEVSEETASDEE